MTKTYSIPYKTGAPAPVIKTVSHTIAEVADAYNWASGIHADWYLDYEASTPEVHVTKGSQGSGGTAGGSYSPTNETWRILGYDGNGGGAFITLPENRRIKSFSMTSSSITGANGIRVSYYLGTTYQGRKDISNSTGSIEFTKDCNILKLGFTQATPSAFVTEFTITYE